MDVFFRFSDKPFWIQVTVRQILMLRPCSVKELWLVTLKFVGIRNGVLTIPTKNIYCRQLLCCQDPIAINVASFITRLCQFKWTFESEPRALVTHPGVSQGQHSHVDGTKEVIVFTSTVASGSIGN
jgi:hypothetical protein